jgi:hypothetical protein
MKSHAPFEAKGVLQAHQNRTKAGKMPRVPGLGPENPSYKNDNGASRSFFYPGLCRPGPELES